jgi:hypothetical protein
MPSARTRRSLPLAGLLAALAAPLIGASSAAAGQTTFHLINERGIAQYGAVVRASDGAFLATDGAGKVTATVSSGDLLRFTRDPQPPSFCSPPEGAGVAYTVPSPAAATATITLPNATGPSFHPELSSAERWVVGRINQLRTARGAPPLMISNTLDRAADASAHDAAGIKASSGRYPWPPAHCDVIAQDWGWPTNTGVGAEDASTTSAAAALAHWTDSSVRGQLTFDPSNTAVGIGDGSGAWVMEIGSCPPGPDVSRCELTSDTGDPNLAHSDGGEGTVQACPASSAPHAKCIAAQKYAKALARCAHLSGTPRAACRQSAHLAYLKALAHARCQPIKNTKKHASCIQHAGRLKA